MTALVRAAFAPYVPAIGREPAPMNADHAALIAAGRVQVAAGGPGGALEGVVVTCAGDGALLLDTVAVAPAAQGRGLGRALVAAAEAEARARGLPTVRLYTIAAMTANLALYPRLG
ncbi:GNAT family N-acetyltransferase [Wenxinia saemankumensis]|uniref:GNAT family N-acetyltransferase n=1 Tax=Wenxinia saemankumensis TaxID=1447782 RepID=UPI001FCDA7ED|nr:GNAT family N-acetyltransferase [Wenxinia saemankumensis]